MKPEIAGDSAPGAVDRLVSRAASEQLAGRADEAVVVLAEALRLDPNHASALTLAALLALRRGHADTALGYTERAIAADPRRARAHHLHGLALQGFGRGAEALTSLRQAVALDGKLIDARLDLGNALLDEGDVAGAAAEIDAVLAAEPSSAIAYNSLGNLRARQRQFDAAVAAYGRAIELDPRLSQAYGNLGMLQFGIGDNDAAIASFRRAVALAPDRPANWSALLFALSVSDGATAASIAAEHRAFGERFAARIAPLSPVVPASRAGRRLKIGYVSSDWRRHAVAVFAEPLLAAHDRGRFEIFCYQNYVGGDEVTARFAALADHFVPIASMRDVEAAERIRADAIDILVDLNGHTAHNRLPLFFLKPAPVQATWLGYLGSTGVPTIDYRLTDVYADPPGAIQATGAEALWRLPLTQWCYRPYVEAPEVGTLPASIADAVTFVCMNHAIKISPTALTLWARILAAVPRSRLMLLATPDAGQRARVLASFAAHGIAADRIEQVGEAPVATYLARYLRADIALDSLPCAGGTTTCDALWMGVPVVTLVGDRPFSRSGASLLRNAGLTGLITRTPDEYVRAAVELATDRARLAALRAGLRDRLRASPLLDAAGFARVVEDAFDAMWERAVAAPRA
ncbi:MAG TPA: tetratricopeptide repeat protein [Casimicrobiaceae bacterium]|nr:tetratricopeptide repeat protein [Casimicrobiaceae bacterium]